MKRRIFNLFDYVVFFTILSALIFSTIMLVILYNEDTKTMNIEPLFKGEPIKEEFLTDEAEAEVEEALNAMPVKTFESSIGVAELFECNLTDDELIAYYKENKPNYIDGYEEPVYIRCTGYCDYGYTKSGEYVREGIVAGKKDWLGKICYIYEVNKDGTCGDLLGEYEFLDTGYGINGSLINGTSIDVWFPSKADVYQWMHDHGDYVYIQIADKESM